MSAVVMKSRRSNQIRLMLLASTMLAGISMLAAAANAQDTTAAETATESVTVTGTAIRGTDSPTGSNLITFDRQSIEDTGAQTTQELLTNIPQVNINFGGAGQANENSNGAGGGAFSEVSIHSLGNQSANTTLVLINGHRIPSVGQSQSVSDPSVIPTLALSRVEVLPDGASSIYGADAVAGVLNFITRSSFEGMETTMQYDVAPQYNGFHVGQLFGASWKGGSVMAAYSYSSLSELMNGDRSFISSRQDLIRGAGATAAQFIGLPAAPPAGSMTTTPAAGSGTTGPFGAAIPYPSTGSNLQTFFCPTATIAANSTGPAFLYPYNGTGISTTQTTPNQGVCDSTNAAASLPSQTRNNGLISIRQSITDKLSVSLDLIYGSLVSNQQVARGTLSATVYGPTGTGPSLGTAQRNPFYVGNATTGTNSEFIRYDFQQLLGPGAFTKASQENKIAVLGFDYDLGGDWISSVDLDMGQSQSPQLTKGQVCTPCANLALNGTANASGSANNTVATSALVDEYGLGTLVSVTRALNASNALDVWDAPGATNKTSPAVLQSLSDNYSYANAIYGLEDFTFKMDGPLSFLNVGAGPVKMAFGGEYKVDTENKITIADSQLGPSTQLSTLSTKDQIRRNSYSGYMELLIPVIGENENIPLVKELTFDISGRYDHYSDFGETKNPKVGITWTPVDGLKGHASYGTSFMAPELAQLGSTPNIRANGIANGTVIPFNSTLPYSTDLTFAGQGIAGTWVANAASCAAAGSNPVNAAGNTVTAASGQAVGCKTNSSASQGISINGVVPDIGPEKGLSYSAGIDLDAGALVGALDGLTLSATYYNTKIQGFITSAGVNVNEPSTVILAPPGGWLPTDPIIQSAIAGKLLNAVLPPVIYSLADGRYRNAFVLWQEGLDFAVNYVLPTESYGNFSFGVSGNQITRFQQGYHDTGVLSIVDGDNAGRETGIEMTAVGTLGWKLDRFAALLTVLYAHPYEVVNANFPYNLPQSNANAGYEHIGALWNENIHLSYDLQKDFLGAGAWSEGMNVFVNVDNILDKNPPYEDIASGQADGNQIGREIMFGFRKAF